jgi:serine/threonine protein kinase
MDWELFYSSFRKPDFIPGYEIQNRLGGGAFGDVYKARKVSIDKHYAIKFLKIDEATSRAAIERELEQVRHFSAIDHPNLVTVEDMGVVQDVPYLVMGYAGEDTLARRQKRERLAGAPALSLFVQICRGVAALHERRLAHFDLKPSNVFLKGDVARVGDYGLAKLLIDGRQTLSFGRGTPHYMAPEMLKNRADERADLYSLGVMLYELYAGKLPFETSSEAGVVLRENDEPPPWPEDMPERVRIAVAGSLRLDPAQRFQSVAKLLEALGQTVRAGDPLVAIESLPPWSGPAPGEPGGPLRPTPAGNRPTPARRVELRTTATDLTRGAVEVARGVWEGLKSPRSPTTPTPWPAPGASPTGAPRGATASSPKTLPPPSPVAEPPLPGVVPPIPAAVTPVPPTPPTPQAQAASAAVRPPPIPSAPPPESLPASAAPRTSAGGIPPLPRTPPEPGAAEIPPLPAAAAWAAAAAGAGSDVVSIQTLEEATLESEALRTPSPPSGLRPSGASQLAPLSQAVPVSWSGSWSGSTAAVPVPPRSTRGVLGTLRATLVLGLEVLTTLVSGPVVRSLGGVGRAGGEFVRGGRGWLLAGLRLSLFLGGMLALGAGLMYLVFLSLHRR